MKRFRGFKIVAVRDDDERKNLLKAVIKDFGFHIVLTCVPQESLAYVYPKRDFPDVKFITVLTGPVPEALVTKSQSLMHLATA
jgi:hypothetical protein